MSVRIAVFASGGGTNLQALLDHFSGAARGTGRIALVVSDRPEVGALERAASAGVDTAVIPHKGRGVGDVEAELLAALAAQEIQLVALAGYVRLVPEEVVRRFRFRMLNIHPGLLPAFGGRGLYGARVHRAVLDAGCRISGPTVHFVDETYDTGPILAQWPVPVLRGDSVETLAARVLRVEHRLYGPALELVAGLVAEGRDPAGLVGTLPQAEGESGEGLSASAFGLTAEDAPSDADVRRALGLE